MPLSQTAALWSPAQPARRDEPSANQRATDFDGDFRIDTYNLKAVGRDKDLQVSFGNARVSRLLFSTETEAPGTLIHSDIDADSDIDLIWVGAHEPPVIWLGDGHGNFLRAQRSEAFHANVQAAWTLWNTPHIESAAFPITPEDSGEETRALSLPAEPWSLLDWPSRVLPTRTTPGARLTPAISNLSNRAPPALAA